MVVAIAVCAVSSGSIFARLSAAPPTMIALGRCLFAAIFFLIWSRFRPLQRRLLNEDKGRMLFGGFALGIHLATWIASLSMTTVGVSVLLVNTTPVWVLLIRYFSTREKPTRIEQVATLLAFAGCGIAVSGSLGGQNSLLGAGLALVGGLAMAVYVSISGFLVKTVDLVHYVAYCYSSAAILLLVVVGIVRPDIAAIPPAGWGYILAMTACAQIVGHTLINRSVGVLPPHRVALALMLEPLLASVAAWAVFREPLTWQLAVAFPLVLGGVALVVRAERITPPAFIEE